MVHYSTLARRHLHDLADFPGTPKLEPTVQSCTDRFQLTKPALDSKKTIPACKLK
jgi:hypothetical protein